MTNRRPINMHMKHTYYTIYKITNNISNKIYIGCHRTNDIDDIYMGSGIHLRAAQKKYGMNNFTKEIIHIFDNVDDMFNMESAIVNEAFVARDDTYNLMTGGSSKNIETGLLNYQNWLNSLSENKRREYFKKRSSVGNAALMKKYHENGGWWFPNPFKGKHHTDESKKKISEANKRNIGPKCSQYNTMWIYSLAEKRSMKISNNTTIPKGWIKGRKMKF